jgi:hypothetical protein
MSNHDTPQVDSPEDDLDAAACTAARQPEGAQADEGALNFKISVRKVQVKVQARGVLAE